MCVCVCGGCTVITGHCSVDRNVIAICMCSVGSPLASDRLSDKGGKESNSSGRHHLARTTPIPRDGPLLVPRDRMSRSDVNPGRDDDDDDDDFENDVAAWREEQSDAGSLRSQGALSSLL